MQPLHPVSIDVKGSKLRPSFLTIRRVATGLLLGAVVLYVPARLYESAYPAAGYLRAFAEAAMIGALADWFAVTALFRRPLGLPIPHTAVVPAHKDRIGTALGKFIESHFLSAEAIAAKLADIDFSAVLARALAEPRNKQMLSGNLAELLPKALDGVPDERIARIATGLVGEHVIRPFEVGPLLSEMLSLLTAENRHQRLIDQLLKETVALLKDSEPLIRDKVSANTSWLWRKLSVDERLAGGIMGAAEDALAKLSEDQHHPWRLRFDRTVRRFIQTLKTSPEFREKGEALKARLLQPPLLEDYLAGLSARLKQSLREDIERPDSAVKTSLSDWLGVTARILVEDPAVRDGFNTWARQSVLELVETRRHEVAGLVTETVQAWDPKTLANRIEERVGDDLQYIRINGTLIGGLAGVLIHVLSQLFFG